MSDRKFNLVKIAFVLALWTAGFIFLPALVALWLPVVVLGSGIVVALIKNGFHGLNAVWLMLKDMAAWFFKPTRMTLKDEAIAAVIVFAVIVAGAGLVKWAKSDDDGEVVFTDTLVEEK